MLPLAVPARAVTLGTSGVPEAHPLGAADAALDPDLCPLPLLELLTLASPVAPALLLPCMKLAEGPSTEGDGVGVSAHAGEAEAGAVASGVCEPTLLAVALAAAVRVPVAVLVVRALLLEDGLPEAEAEAAAGEALLVPLPGPCDADPHPGDALPPPTVALVSGVSVPRCTDAVARALAVREAPPPRLAVGSRLPLDVLVLRPVPLASAVGAGLALVVRVLTPAPRLSVALALPVPPAAEAEALLLALTAPLPLALALEVALGSAEAVAASALRVAPCTCVGVALPPVAVAVAEALKLPEAEAGEEALPELVPPPALPVQPALPVARADMLPPPLAVALAQWGAVAHVVPLPPLPTPFDAVAGAVRAADALGEAVAQGVLSGLLVGGRVKLLVLVCELERVAQEDRLSRAEEVGVPPCSGEALALAEDWPKSEAVAWLVGSAAADDEPLTLEDAVPCALAAELGLGGGERLTRPPVGVAKPLCPAVALLQGEGGAEALSAADALAAADTVPIPPELSVGAKGVRVLDEASVAVAMEEALAVGGASELEASALALPLLALLPVAGALAVKKSLAVPGTVLLPSKLGEGVGVGAELGEESGEVEPLLLPRPLALPA